MKLISYLERLEDLRYCRSGEVDELILSPRKLSRFGILSLEECYKAALYCQEKGIRPLLEWDILMTETVFSRIRSLLKQVDWRCFAGVRVQDIGALNYLIENVPKIKIQLILETGNHNLRGIQTWVEKVSHSLDRVILSPEITQKNLEHYLKELSVPVEILGLGRILLFYTPRALLSPVSPNDSKEEISATPLEGTSRHFPVLENIHGTFLFHSKDRFILHLATELSNMGLGALRLDFRFGRDSSLVSEVISEIQTGGSFQEIKAKWPSPLTQGFFKTNKTDAPFKNLKNRRLPVAEKGYLGEVLESVKGKYIALQIKSSESFLKKGVLLKIYTPEGKKKIHLAAFCKNTCLKELEREAKQGEVVLIPPLAGVTTKSVVYLNENHS